MSDPIPVFQQKIISELDSGVRPGNNVVYLGDSITARGNNDNIGFNGPDGFPHYSAILSNRQLNYIHNAGKAGDRTDQMLARFDTDVTPYSPNVVIILGGTNDTGQSISLITIRQNIMAIVDKVYSIGAKPVLCTIPPNGTGTPTDRKQRIIALNIWIRRFAASNGIDLVDFYNLLVDPANGNYLSLYNNDGTHPNTTGDFAMGQLVANTLSHSLPQIFPPLPYDNNDPYNFLVNGLFLNGISGSAPTNWINQSGVTGQTLSLVTGDTSIKGSWFKFTASASSAASILFTNDLSSNSNGDAIVAGHTYAMIGRIKSGSISANQTLTVIMRFKGASPNVDFRPVNQMTQTIPNGGIFYVEGVAPLGASTVQALLQIDAGTGDVSFAQVGIYDLSKMNVM